ncbi:hypothetical protein JTE90_023509 [Oedothorax gibbosus]|uniref:Acyltransferase 3 domain-containing protein n=1 Tax=Oedothorax gibbosus TaxID=931172 RepID=A0AAV6VSU1_9ARAC|nr:hypothetical protein JTE90_023509 [Oedothorax gibbosus]
MVSSLATLCNKRCNISFFKTMDIRAKFSYSSSEYMSELPQIFTRMGMNRFGESFFNSTTTELMLKNHLEKFTIIDFSMICLLYSFLVLNCIGSAITAHENFKGNFPKQFIPKGSVKKKKKSQDCITQHQDLILLDWIAKCKEFLNCFCLFTNTRNLLNTKPARGNISCLHGLRFISQFWIIFCHVGGNFSGHMYFLDTYCYRIGTLVIFHSVDTFFLLSGMLNAFSFFQNETKNERKSWFHYYAHRFFRLTPLYMVILGFYTSLFPKIIGSGPLWSPYPGERTCRKHWWRNMLYISNIWPVTEMCMVWSWFLSTDMQFYIISPVFLITMKRWPTIRNAVLLLLICGTILANFIITCNLKLPNFLFHMYLNLEQKTAYSLYIEKLLKYYDHVYVMPYMRMAPYIIGMGTAYYVYRWQKKQIKFSKACLCCGYTISTILLLYSFLGISWGQPSILQASLYNALNQVSFAIVVAWLILVSITGQGGIVSKILSSKIWIPGSRLSYCAYLIHPLFMFGYFTSLTEPIEFSYTTMLSTMCWLTLGSFGVALVIHLLIECPITRLEKLLCK